MIMINNYKNFFNKIKKKKFQFKIIKKTCSQNLSQMNRDLKFYKN